MENAFNVRYMPHNILHFFDEMNVEKRFSANSALDTVSLIDFPEVNGNTPSC